MTAFNHSGFTTIARRTGPTAVDMAGAMIFVLFFLLIFVAGFGIAMEQNATELERQSSNASGCLSLFQETGNPEYAQRAQEALLFSDRPCL